MKQSDSLSLCTAFDGHRRIASGELHIVAMTVRQMLAANPANAVFIYDDATGHLVDLDLRGASSELSARPIDEQPPPAEPPPGARGRGRPKLGVVSREVTLLPRHWEWLASQPGGASVALRKLVEDARRTHQEADRARQRQEAAYRFMSSIGGDLPGFEEATRALFAHDQEQLVKHMAAWPPDVRGHALRLAFG